MQHVLIIHEVVAYPAWKAVFDQAANIAIRAGEIDYRLLRYDNEKTTPAFHHPYPAFRVRNPVIDPTALSNPPHYQDTLNQSLPIRLF